MQLKLKKGDIVIQRTNELTVEEVIGTTVHCKMANGQPLQLEQSDVVLVDANIIKTLENDAKQVGREIGSIFEKKEPQAPVAPVSVSKEVVA